MCMSERKERSISQSSKRISKYTCLDSKVTIWIWDRKIITDAVDIKTVPIYRIISYLTYYLHKYSEY